MSRHEGVSCDACLKGNFRGRRYKCLICYDYDLCANCYESGAASSQHSSSHAMQCILTRSDYDLFYGGEIGGSSGAENPQSYTCPFCAVPGFTEGTLADHVSEQHTTATQEVVCPVCASLPGGDPNHVTSDLSSHLTMGHRVHAASAASSSSSGHRDLISFPDEPLGGASLVSGGVRGSSAGWRRVGRGRIAARDRRAANVHGGSSVGRGVAPPPPPPTSSLPILSSSEFVALATASGSDPIADLLSQLSGVRRLAPSSSSSSSSTLQQLQMQLQVAASTQQARQERSTIRTARALSSGGPSVTGTNSIPPTVIGGASGSAMQILTGGVGASLSSGSGAGAITSNNYVLSDRHLAHSAGGLSLAASGSDSSSSVSSVGGFGNCLLGGESGTQTGGDTSSSGFLLRQLSDDEAEYDSGSVSKSWAKTAADAELMRFKKSQFLQELLLSTLSIESGDDDDNESKNGKLRATDSGPLLQ